MSITTGLIVKALSGFYYVCVDNNEYECRAKGIFRKDNTSIYVGDRVEIELLEDGKAQVVKVLERKNSLIRPPVANLDYLVMVVSVCEPVPNLIVLDKLIAISEYKDITPLIVITKMDLSEHYDLENIYLRAGYKVFCVSSATGEGVAELKKELVGNISAFSGNTGVGKSSLLNAIDSRLDIATNEISQKLGRGKHTTTHVSLYELDGGGYIADTPGFSSVDVDKFQIITKDKLQYCFIEFEDYIPECKYNGCSHTKEKSCAILKAVEDGEIAKSRHESYLMMYEDAKNIKEWELKD